MPIYDPFPDTFTATNNSRHALCGLANAAGALWYIFPPISFVVHPKTTQIGADGIIE